MNDSTDASAIDSEIDLSIVIPVYGSEATLQSLVERLVQALSPRTGRFELICVDDDSPDGAWKVLEGLRRRHAGQLVAIRLMRNFGQHNATMCGLKVARGRVVVTMDDDLQHQPEDVPALVQHLEATGLDLVYGTHARKSHSAFRNLGSRALNAVFRRLFGVPVNFSAFRAIRRQAVRAITSYDLNYTFIDGLLAWTTTRIGEIEVSHEPRRSGRSGYGLATLLVLALNLVTNFSLVPLQIASLIGTVAALGGLATGVVIVAVYFMGVIQVPGWASTITAVFVLGGIQLLALGAIGEYLGRLHLNFNRKPQYLVREARGVADVTTDARDADR